MTAKTTCAPTAHHFAKFDDATIFCENCGEQRVMDLQALIAKFPQPPIYLPCPGPHIVPWTPYPWIVTTGTTWAPTDPVTITYVDDNTTFTGLV
jgi:hypothetical protein